MRLIENIKLWTRVKKGEVGRGVIVQYLSFVIHRLTQWMNGVNRETGTIVRTNLRINSVVLVARSCVSFLVSHSFHLLFHGYLFPTLTLLVSYLNTLLSQLSCLEIATPSRGWGDEHYWWIGRDPVNPGSGSFTHSPMKSSNNWASSMVVPGAPLLALCAACMYLLCSIYAFFFFLPRPISIGCYNRPLWTVERGRNG